MKDLTPFWDGDKDTPKVQAVFWIVVLVLLTPVLAVSSGLFWLRSLYREVVEVERCERLKGLVVTALMLLVLPCLWLYDKFQRHEVE